MLRFCIPQSTFTLEASTSECVPVTFYDSLHPNPDKSFSFRGLSLCSMHTKQSDVTCKVHFKWSDVSFSHVPTQVTMTMLISLPCTHKGKSLFLHVEWLQLVLSYSTWRLSMNKSGPRVSLSLVQLLLLFYLSPHTAQSKHCSSSSCLRGWKHRGEPSLPHLSVLHSG